MPTLSRIFSTVKCCTAILGQAPLDLANLAMSGWADVTGTEGVLALIAQIGGLDCAGTMAQLSTSTNESINENLVFLLQTLRNMGVSIDSKLLCAASLGMEAAVSALLKARADKNAANQTGATPLFIAAQNGHEAVVSALVGARKAGRRHAIVHRG